MSTAPTGTRRATVAGVLLANAVPHVWWGLRGRRHLTPFGRDSSPRVNRWWGVANAVAGAALLATADDPDRGVRAARGFGGFALWALVSENLSRWVLARRRGGPAAT